MTTLRFTAEHEWLHLEENGEVAIGITEHAQHALGDVVFVQLPELDQYDKGAEVVVLESVKAASDIAMPMRGEVIAVNEALVDSPELVNSLPMLEGWFFRIQPASLEGFEALMDQEAYDRYLADHDA